MAFLKIFSFKLDVFVFIIYNNIVGASVGKEVCKFMDILSFILSVLASVVAYYICKTLDNRR